MNDRIVKQGRPLDWILILRWQVEYDINVVDKLVVIYQCGVIGFSIIVFNNSKGLLN